MVIVFYYKGTCFSQHVFNYLQLNVNIKKKHITTQATRSEPGSRNNATQCFNLFSVGVNVPFRLADDGSTESNFWSLYTSVEKYM